VALDPTLALLDYPVDTVLASLPTADRPLVRLGGGPPLSLLYTRPAAGPGAENPGTDGLYRYLERRGIVAIAAGRDASTTEIELAGGSVCRSTVRRSGRDWLVRKEITASALPSRDARDRHVEEARWLQDMTNGNGLSCFPRVRSLCAEDGRLVWTSDFVPGYTLGERLIQGREDSRSLAGKLRDVVDLLAQQLHWRRCDRPQQSYADVVTRRFDVLRRQSRIYDDLWRHGAVVNGVAYPPVEWLLSWLGSERLDAVLRPSGGRECHGDLILEDILCTEGPGIGFTFVDPNPLNASPLVDYGKILMNLLSGYDFAYRDWVGVSCEHDRRGSAPVLGVSSHVPEMFQDCLRIYGEVAEHVAAVARTSRSGDECTLRVLTVQAALHALALPIFHDVHHRSRQRAVYFALSGMHILTSVACGTWENGPTGIV
jgi:hypothetical protein